MAPSLGKYDHLSDAERRRKSRVAGLSAAACMAGSLIVSRLDRRYGWSSQSSLAELLVAAVEIGLSIAGIVLIVRLIALQSPNPKRLPPAE
ncbi:MAG: hypothetical protein JNK76_15475 [Planctomycetales bacterium]|nr:hypothetical protein [Planctomycetales bacterium]MBN8626805.1 hypothetical protein [Planctomycetota bacterium]